jgi:predicted phage terminase large subunit-like protein
VAQYEPLPLLDFIPALTPRWTRPEHLAPLAECFERARRGPVFVFGTTAPRFGKTELIKHGIVQRLLDDPTRRIAYGSYSARAAHKRSREIRKLYLRAGGKVDQRASSVADWRTGHDDGGLWAAGTEGGWTGEGFDLMVLDDPVKGRAQAESAVERETLWDFFRDDFETRIEPGGSILVIHTRWTIDDLGGRLISGLARDAYEHVRLPAIDDAGRALWPERWPLDVLRKIEKSKGAYAWESLYMGRPFARGGRLFNAPTQKQFYTVRPAKLRIALGVDLAYSKKTHADHSVIVILGIDDATGKTYVLDVQSFQIASPLFAARLKLVQERYRGVEARWYYAGAELGIADFIRTLEVDLDAVPASSDKFVRAQPVAAAWNDEKILIPREAPWLERFLRILAAFTGVDDLEDDEVDALAGAYDSSEQPNWVTAMQKWREAQGPGPHRA